MNDTAKLCRSAVSLQGGRGEEGVVVEGEEGIEFGNLGNPR